MQVTVADTQEVSNLRNTNDSSHPMQPYHPDWKKDEDIMSKLDYFRKAHNFLLKAPYETMVSIDNWELKFIDALRLAPGTVLNDAVMNFFFKLFVNFHLTPNQRRDIFQFNTFFWKKLNSVAESVEQNSKTQASANFRFKESYQKLKVFHKGVDLFSKKHLFIPIHKEGHWCAIIVTNLPSLLHRYKQIAADGKEDTAETDFIRGPKILQFDPLYRADARHGAIVRHYLELLLEEALESKAYHRAKTVLKRSPHDSLLDFAAIPDLQVIAPRQINRVDCGLFIMEYFEAFAENHKKILQLLDANGEVHRLFPLSMISNKRTMLFNVLVRHSETQSMELALTRYTQEKQIVMSESSSHPEEYDTEGLEQSKDAFTLKKDGSKSDFGDFYFATVDGKWTRFVGNSGSKQKTVPEVGVKKRYRFDDPNRPLTLADIYYSVLPSGVALESAGGVEEIEVCAEQVNRPSPLANPNRSANIRSKLAQNRKAVESYTQKLEARNEARLGKRTDFEVSIQEVLQHPVLRPKQPIELVLYECLDPDSMETAEELEIVEVDKPKRKHLQNSGMLAGIKQKAQSARESSKKQPLPVLTGGWTGITQRPGSASKFGEIAVSGRIGMENVHSYSRFGYRTLAKVGF